MSGDPDMSVGSPEDRAHERQLISGRRRRDTLLIQMVNAYNSGAVAMRSADIDLGDPAIAPHPWHEEWMAAARREIDAMETLNAENHQKSDQA